MKWLDMRRSWASPRISSPASSGRTRFRRRFTACVEQLEDRRLPATGFLQGIAFVDANGNHQYDLGVDTPKVGATIQLFSISDLQNPIASRSTAADGSYQFTNLAAGTYRLKEVPPAGFVNDDVEILSQVNPAVKIDSSTIEVTLLESVMLKFFHGSTSENLTATFVWFGQTHTDSQAEQMALSVGDQPAPEFYGFCTDMPHIVSANQVYQVIPGPIPASDPDALASSAGRIGWLYNHYGTVLLTNPAESQGLQLAVWELLYDASPDLNNGNFKVISGVPGAVAAAQNYLDISAGKSELVSFLNLPPGAPPDGGQGMIAPSSFNFSNVPDHVHEGRMTGGGSIFTPEGMRVTHGFELHCDISIQPNRLQVNLHNPQRDRFHLESMISAECFDDPAIEPDPPPAPIDTYVGWGLGRLNGVSGYTIRFTFTDAGEPGRDDTAAYLIWLDSNNNGVVDGDETPVLDVGPTPLTFGNHQAHAENKPSTTTQGAWQAHSNTAAFPDYWPQTGLSPSQRVKNTFSRAGSTPYASLGNDTLLTTLGYAGGTNLHGAAETLLRAATAALLDASHPEVSYALTPADVVAQVNAALDTRDIATITTLASTLTEPEALRHWQIETEPLQAAGAGAGDAASTPALTQDLVQPIFAEAIARWQAAGVSGEQLAMLSQMHVGIADLPGGYLGVTSASLIQLDVNAAGYGWFIDSTPADDWEFVAPGDPAAAARIDLLTVVAHEMGHALGLEHGGAGLMCAEVAPGVRHSPGCGCTSCAAAANVIAAAAEFNQEPMASDTILQPAAVDAQTLLALWSFAEMADQMDVVLTVDAAPSGQGSDGNVPDGGLATDEADSSDSQLAADAWFAIGVNEPLPDDALISLMFETLDDAMAELKPAWDT
jgi:hypothetical protein